MEIIEAIIHGLHKEARTNQVRENFRSALTPSNNYLETLGDELLKAYAHASNNYGCFDADAATHPFQSRLNEYLDGDTQAHGLVGFSHSACRLIKSQLEGSFFATGGYVCFLRYQNQGKDWLLVVMIKLKAQIGINESDVTLEENMSFDMGHLHEAARIDLGKWRQNEEPYLSFVKLRDSKDEVTRYFRLALGCTDYTNSKANTQQAIAAVNAYCEEQDWDLDRCIQARQAVFDHFQQKNAQGEPVNKVALSALINDQEPEDFSRFVAEHNYEINETFAPHARTFRILKRIQRKFGSISVAFDVADVISHKVDYDVASGRLYIVEPPQVLIDDIRRYKDDDTSD